MQGSGLNNRVASTEQTFHKCPRIFARHRGEIVNGYDAQPPDFGGAFTDCAGNPLANGYLVLQLSHDESHTSGPNQVVSGLKIKIGLDSSGNIPVSPATMIYSVDTLAPANAYFLAVGYKSDGPQAWGPQLLAPTSSPNPLNIGSIVPLSPPGGLNLNDLETITLQTNGVNNSNQSLLNLAAGSGVTLSNSAGTTLISAGPSAPQVGDIQRYNVSGDNAWDAVNYAQRFSAVYAVVGSGTPNTVGPITGLGTLSAAHNDVLATATSGPGETYLANASASLNTVIGLALGSNGNNSIGPILAFYRVSIKFKPGQSTNSRYWLGLGCFNNSSSLGHNSQAILGTTAYAANSPNKTTIGFRYSAGADTNWQAVVCSAGSGQTTVDTGVAIDTTNPHIFDFAPNFTGTAINFLIDYQLKVTISTNIPPQNGGDSQMSLFWSHVQTRGWVVSFLRRAKCLDTAGSRVSEDFAPAPTLIPVPAKPQFTGADLGKPEIKSTIAPTMLWQ